MIANLLLAILTMLVPPPPTAEPDTAKPAVDAVPTAVASLAPPAAPAAESARASRRAARTEGRGGGQSIPVADHPQDVGDAGVAWYTTWETGLAEAKRSNRPIFFMAAATCSSGVPGTF